MIKPRPPMKIGAMAGHSIKQVKMSNAFLRELGIKYIDLEWIDAGRGFDGKRGRLFRVRYSIIERPHLIHQNETFLGEHDEVSRGIPMMGEWVYLDSRARIADALKEKIKMQGMNKIKIHNLF